MKEIKRKRKTGLPASTLFAILKKAAARLRQNSPLHLAGSTAFFATFSLAPIFYLIVQFLGSFVGKAETKQSVLRKFAENAPKESVEQFRQLLEGLERLSGAWYVRVGLFLFLVFSASTLFKVIQSALCRLWRIKRVEEKGVGFALRNRLFSVALIIAAGVLLVLGWLGQDLQPILAEAVKEISPVAASYFHSLYRYIISMLMAWMWFAVVFRYLTDARPQWRTVFAGSFFTTILFSIGKLILQAILPVGNLPSVFGASASLVILQLFVFYSSLLIYYGAAFTMEWARHYKQRIALPDYMSYYTVDEKHVKETREQG